jgi:hypothetical protein
VKGHGTKFGRKKEAAIAALLTQKNHEEAARATGIGLKTLKRWLRLPEFIEEYRRARWEVTEQAYARAQQNAGAAASVLLKLMVDPTTPAPARIRAALGIFGLAREALDLDIDTRVSDWSAGPHSGVFTEVTDECSDIVPIDATRNASGVAPALGFPHRLAEAAPRGVRRRAPCRDRRKRTVLFLPYGSVRI